MKCFVNSSSNNISNNYGVDNSAYNHDIQSSIPHESPPPII